MNFTDFTNEIEQFKFYMPVKTDNLGFPNKKKSKNRKYIKTAAQIKRISKKIRNKRK